MTGSDSQIVAGIATHVIVVVLADWTAQRPPKQTSVEVHIDRLPPWGAGMLPVAVALGMIAGGTKADVAGAAELLGGGGATAEVTCGGGGAAEEAGVPAVDVGLAGALEGFVVVRCPEPVGSSGGA